MNDATWFERQFQSGADGFIWGVEQVPPERRRLRPPAPLGDWSAARHAFHLLFYESNIALPSMRHWLGDPLPSLRGLNEELAFQRAPETAEVGEQFRQVRAEQLALLPQFDASAWDAPRDTVWGAVTLRWVATKTVQHTAEHTHDVLCLALYWDSVADRMRGRGH